MARHSSRPSAAIRFAHDGGGIAPVGTQECVELLCARAARLEIGRVDRDLVDEREDEECLWESVRVGAARRFADADDLRAAEGVEHGGSREGRGIARIERIAGAAPRSSAGLVRMASAASRTELGAARQAGSAWMATAANAMQERRMRTRCTTG